MKNEIKVIANLPIKGMDVIKRCYSGGGISPSLTTMQGGQREPKILQRRIAKK
jgi:DNA (cytosine-5)-methyltransferase 1